MLEHLLAKVRTENGVKITETLAEHTDAVVKK